MRQLINNRNLFLIVLEARKSKIKALADSVSGKGPFLDSKMVFFSVSPHVAEAMRELPEVCFLRALIEFMRALISRPNHLPRSTFKYDHIGG